MRQDPAWTLRRTWSVCASCSEPGAKVAGGTVPGGKHADPARVSLAFALHAILNARMRKGDRPWPHIPKALAVFTSFEEIQ
jgi:hypothetical protein